jgi:outer membrane protein OmpA-like peptidoglycan-associated protein
MKKCFSLPVLVVAFFAAQSQTFSPRYELVKIGSQVNTFYHEAAPVVSPDGKDLYFFVANHPENTFGKDNSQDIWVTHKDDNGAWSPAKRLGPPLNQNRANQVFQVLPNGSLLVRGKAKSEKGFSLVTPSGSWTELRIKDFDSMNKGRFSGATISADGRHMVLYFSEIENSIRSDLYITHDLGDGQWSRPEKLKISNNSDEFGPFIGPDNKTLYFASDRSAPGKQGGADIYKSERLDDSWNNWSEPVNLGKPINTAAGDAYFTIDANGNVYTSRANSRVDGGNLDIFMLIPKNIKVKIAGVVLNAKNNQSLAANVVVSLKDQKPITLKVPISGKFETRIPEIDQYVVSATAEGFLPKEETFSVPPLQGDTTLNIEILLTPIAKKLVLTGTVYNKKDNTPVSAKVVITRPPTRVAPVVLQTNASGQYEHDITAMGWYSLSGSAEGFLNAADSVEVVSEEQTPIQKDLYLQPIEVGVTVRLKNIYFDFDKTTLKPESFTELNKVVDLLKQNPSVEIEIAGHTDSKGSDDYNRNLSQGRSQAVVDYIISQGIDNYRLTARGYGEAKPIDTNDTEEGRANNRRVEFTVVKK